MHEDVVSNLGKVRSHIETACRKAGRDPSSVSLVAVSKTHGIERILPALEAGQRVFGENRVQEAKAKWPALKARFPNIVLHLIGPLQSNKVKEAVALFDMIETLDRPSLAEALAREMARQNRHPLLMVQINTGAEPQKAGVLPKDADEFLKTCRECFGLKIEGLMCIPPVEEDPTPHFAQLCDIARRHGLKHLSMGMSHDYETAIGLGATHVRVGTAIFGQRIGGQRIGGQESGVRS